jgi:LPXTG-motif cell wall-anchored protein
VPSSVVDTTGPPPTASGVAARSDTLPATGQDHWILVVMAVMLLVAGALCLIKVRLTRKEEGR